MKRAEILSWCLYDLASASYRAIIMTVVYPVYFVDKVVGNAGGEGDLWWGRVISLSMAIVAMMAPVIGAFADYGGVRKRFLAISTLVSVTAIAALYVVKPGMVLYGVVLVIIANIGYETAMVFYNAYLSDIAETHYQGRVSAWGFALGYLGSLMSLGIAWPLVNAQALGTLWLATAVFFLVFSLPAFIYLPADKKTATVAGSISGHLGTLADNFRQLWQMSQLKKFMLAYFFYADGTNTVIAFSSIYAATTIKVPTAQLIYLFLIVQVTAIVGAVVMANPIDKWGGKKVIVISLLHWSCITISAYFITTQTAFFLLCAAAGLGLGTIQAASRTYFAGFIPHGRQAEFFGLYAMIGKTSAILGPLLFGALSAHFKSQRPAIISITLLFVAGLAFILTVKKQNSLV
ncbi:MAG: MFS transporter [Candidatus Magnetobacterium sp. LHC-1]|uniref:MFS transporter n=1 Tax=Candidatus Magnetobacterium casense TaxID=1455061 RepID=A0ABS6RXT0_9BACT|nr:MFS transporter [Candidatus Magnetobacterium casensis]MBF0608931.1 MFS transporter [Nitrospirota bacterium]MBV6341447.1 MFS transporter [Candidatus Magnetobacterium casensis]